MAAVERGMEIAQRIGDRGSEAYAAVFQGKIAMNRGYLEEALALFRRAKAATDATGIPYMRALGLCVTGTCYQTIGGSMVETALDYHQRTLDTMELPTGTTLGAWLWSEVGHCALAAGNVGDAKVLFRKAIEEKTAPMFLMRPSALMGEIEVAIVEDRITDAREVFAELEDYVTSRHMRDHYISLPYVAARIEAAAGNHDGALKSLDECEEMAADGEMRRTLLDIHAAQARSFGALGRTEEAAAAREKANSVAGAIAAGMNDAELREAFVANTAGLLSSVSS
jgi:ATP/maltotriose-dependent transcriptional regulator MalT